MKRSLLCLGVLITLCFGLSLPASAVPAAPTLHTLRQPDGTSLQARLRGDEWRHWYETPTGQTIAQDARTKRWVPSVRPAAVRKPVTSGPRMTVRTAAVSGERSVPVLCVNFTDRTPTYATSAFESALFGTTGRTMRTYFSEVSYGAFTVNSGVSGIGGWYTASNAHDYYGYNNGFARAQALALETVKAADAAYNFAPYDTNGDGYVEAVCIAHQGAGAEASGSGTDIWSHSWALATPYLTNDGVYVYSYVMQPETAPTSWGGYMTTAGVYCHEYGHALGLPDLYDTDSSSEGLGNWSLMAGGSWNSVTRLGDSPAHLDAWCKARLGWINPVVVTSALVGQAIPQAESSPTAFKLYAKGTSGSEYYLVENRQRTLFDAGLPGSGLLVYHLDDTQATNNNEWYPGHTTYGHYRVALEQADNLYRLEGMGGMTDRGDAGDPFPGTTANRLFSDGSAPNSKPYDQTIGQVQISSISASGATMTADLQPQPSIFSVDALVSNPSPDAYLGDGIRNLDGTGQTKAQSVAAGGVATYNVQVQNDGTLADTIKVTGPASDATWQITYYDALSGGNDITAEVTGVGKSVALAPGGVLQWRAVVQGPSAAASKDILITAASASDPGLADAVKAQTAVVITTAKPDLRLISSTGAYVGDNVYNTDGTSQTLSQTADTTKKATFKVSLQNDGTATGSFVVRAPAAVSGWKVVYYSALTKGTDVTSAITSSAGWSVGSIAAGGKVDFRFEVTPSSTLPSGASLSTLLTVSSTGSTVVADAVLGVTTKAAASKRTKTAGIAALSAQPVRRGGAQVTVSLLAPAQVTATVLNCAGRVIATVVTGRTLDGGLQTLSWNGRSSSGLAVPSGMYFVRVDAYSDGGTMSTAMAGVNLRR